MNLIVVFFLFTIWVFFSISYVFFLKHNTQHKQTKPDKAIGKHPSQAHILGNEPAGISPADHWV
jgi:hypothetical protein